MEEKNQMRAAVLARRDTIPEETRAQKSAAVCLRVEALVADACDGRVPKVAVYAAMRSEVNLGAFVEAAYARGWQVCFPCMVRDQADAPSRMAFYHVPAARLTQAREAFLDKPLKCLTCAALAADDYAEVDPEQLDAVVVPLVAFDDEGGRLGYGGGNYDQLLPRLRPDAQVVGVAFEEQRVGSVPREPHDWPLPHIVSA